MTCFCVYVCVFAACVYSGDDRADASALSAQCACVCVLYEPISKVIESVEMLYTKSRVYHTEVNVKVKHFCMW